MVNGVTGNCPQRTAAVHLWRVAGHSRETPVPTVAWTALRRMDGTALTLPALGVVGADSG